MQLVKRFLHFVLAAACLICPSKVAAQDIYVTDWATNLVSRSRPDGLVVSTISNPKLQFATDIAVDSQGFVYVTSEDFHAVIRFSPTNEFVDMFIPSGLDCKPNGLTFDSAGNLYVTNYCGNTIQIYDISASQIGIINSGLDGPRSLAFDKNGILYVANRNSLNISRFQKSDETYVFLDSFYSGVVDPFGLAFDSHGNLFASGEFSGSVARFASSDSGLSLTPTTYIQGLAPGAGSTAGILFDANDNLFVAQWSRVHKFAESGLGYAFESESAADPYVFATGFVRAIGVAASRGSDMTPPVVVAGAKPPVVRTVGPGAIGSMVVKGTITDATSGVDPSCAAYSVVDSYGTVQPSGAVAVNANGSYSVMIPLEAYASGKVRSYKITVKTRDKAGNMRSAQCAFTVILQ